MKNLLIGLFNTNPEKDIGVVIYDYPNYVVYKMVNHALLFKLVEFNKMKYVR